MPKTFWTLLVCAVLGCSPLCFAQPIGVGLKLGTTLTDAVSSAESESIPNSNTLIVGPYIELRLPAGLSIEGDALYFPGLYSNAVGGASVWQFPILLKAGLQLGPVRPYIEGGPSYSHLSDIKTITDILHSSNYGITLGAGLEVKIKAFRIAPEIRYNGVALTNIQSPLGIFKSTNHQVVFLVGIGF